MVPTRMNGPETKPPGEFSAEDDARLLGKAHEVRRDGKRMRAVKMHIRTMNKAIAHGTVGRKGISPGLTKRIAAGKVHKRGSRAPRHARGGR